MTTAQTIFVVFFAIFWGAIFNVQGRWKMFQPILRIRYICRRFWFSFAVVNVLPIIYFVWAFYMLNCTSTEATSSWDPLQTVQQLVSGLLPAFAIFGFYRLWMGVVELRPTWFYERRSEQSIFLAAIDPSVEKLGLHHPYKWWNLRVVPIYRAIAGVGLWLAQWSRP